jgi:hypothetical protein
VSRLLGPDTNSRNPVRSYLGRRSGLIVAAACIAACSSPPAAAPGSGAIPDANAQTKSAALGDTVHIELGRSASVDRGRLLLTFVSRGADSRCPANVVCVWMGDVAVRIAARAGAASVERDLHTGVEPHALTIDGYIVTVVGLLPYPGTESPNAPAGSPTVLLRVTK